MIAVAFCADKNMEAALHVAACSLLQNLNPREAVRFYLLLTGFSERDIEKLRHTLDRTERSYELRLPKLPDPRTFRDFRPLHGNLVPYHRILLPEVVDEARLLYLDADTLTTVDVSPLFSLPMEGRATGFVVDGIMSNNPDREFLIAQGLKPTSRVFNSGVMLFDIERWREQDCTQRCLDLCRRTYKHDQPVLTVMFAEDTCCLPVEFNMKLYPATPAEEGLAGICHFVGSPKPWDLGGSFLVRSSWLWLEYARRTSIETRAWLSWRAWRRATRILGGYRRAVRDNVLKR